MLAYVTILHKILSTLHQMLGNGMLHLEALEVVKCAKHQKSSKKSSFIVLLNCPTGQLQMDCFITPQVLMCDGVLRFSLFVLPQSWFSGKWRHIWKVTILLEIHPLFTEPWLWEEAFVQHTTNHSQQHDHHVWGFRLQRPTGCRWRAEDGRYAMETLFCTSVIHCNVI